MIIGRTVRAGRWNEKKRTGQDKSHKRVIFHLFGGSPHSSDLHQNCVVSDLLDVITCAKFQNEIFRGYHFTGGRIFQFAYNSAALLRWL